MRRFASSDRFIKTTASTQESPRTEKKLLFRDFVNLDAESFTIELFTGEENYRLNLYNYQK